MRDVTSTVLNFRPVMYRNVEQTFILFHLIHTYIHIRICVFMCCVHPMCELSRITKFHENHQHPYVLAVAAMHNTTEQNALRELQNK